MADGALDSVSTDDQDQATPTGGLSTVAGGPMVSVPKSKTGLSVAGNVPLDPTQTAEILKNMQALIDQRNSPEAKMQNDLADALAYGAPINLGGAPLRNRMTDKYNQQQTTMDMQNQMLAYKAAMAQYQNQMGNANELLGQGQGQGQAGGAGQPQTNPNVVDTSQVPDSVRREMNVYIKNRDPAGAMASYNKWLGTVSTENVKAVNNPAWSDTVPVIDPSSGQTINVPKRDAWKYPTTMPTNTAQPAANIPAPNGTPINPAAPAPTQPATGGYHGVAADVNNAVGIKSPTGGFVRYDTPQAGVQAAVDLNSKYLAGQGPMQGIKPTIANMTGMWVNGDATKTVPAYNNFLVGELNKAGIQVGPDGSIPNTPQAAQALTAARIKFESGKNAAKFLPYVTAQNTPAAPTTPAAAAPTTPAGAPAAAPAASAASSVAAPATAAPLTGNVVTPTAPVAQVPYNPPSTVITADESKFKPGESIPSHDARLKALQAEKEAKLNQYNKQYEAQSAANLNVTQASANKINEDEAKKRAEYQDDYTNGSSSYDTFKKGLNAAVGHKNVFNLSGQNDVNYLAGRLLIKGKTDLGSAANDELAKSMLVNEDQSYYNDINKYSKEAQAAWAKNLAKGAGSKLTNMDLKLADPAKGVGPSMTYESHLLNSAQNMEVTKTMELRAKAWKQYSESHPNATTADFEQSPAYTDAKDKARVIVGREIAKIPEFKNSPILKNQYLQYDASGKPYIVRENGKGYYL